MDDKIELPPLPKAIEPMHSTAAMEQYARAAVIADRERRAEPSKPAKPKVHSATLQLTTRGNAVMNPAINSIYACATVILNWTDDGRAWIDSERNRELATSLRALSYSSCAPKLCHDAADSLDGGVR